MQKIFLIGFMGAGKTSVGRALARQLDAAFVDTDVYIEEQEGKSISAIFAGQGEEAFRELETKVLAGLCEADESYVIATGGGLVMREANQELLKKQKYVVYLEAAPETVYERLKGDTTRPLLQGTDAMSKIRDLLMFRSPTYEGVAKTKIAVDGLTIEEICAAVKKTLEKDSFLL